MNELNNYLLTHYFLENPLSAFARFGLILFLGLLLKHYGANMISRQSFRMFKQFSHNQFSEVFVSMLSRPVERLLALIILYWAFVQLTFPHSWDLAHHNEYGLKWLIKVVFGVVVFYRVTLLFLRVTDFFTHVLQNREDAPISVELSNFLKELIKVLVVVLFVFAGLRFVFKVNITALVASLGIGGLAIALAAQDTLANLLASFIIYIDKPFKANDLVEFDGISGRVEHVGFRTTRVRTLDRSLLTVPNKKLIDAALNNVTLSESRRVKFNISVTYTTSHEQIQAIVEDIKTAIQRHPKTNDDYFVRFSDFSSSSLDILVLYFVMSNEFADMIEVKEEINFQIMEIVHRHKASFAFPSQSVYVEKLPVSNNSHA
jgi:MscS family membrane protein